MITPTGRKVQCSNCAHQWRVFLSTEGEPVNEVIIQQTIESKAQETPSLAPKAKTYSAHHKAKTQSSLANAPLLKKTAIAASFLALILFLAINFLVQQAVIIDSMPFTKSIYSALGLIHDEGIKLQSVDCKVSEVSEQGSDLIELDVKVELINTAKTNQTISNVRFSVYDKEKNFLGDYTIEFNKTLSPQETESIEGRLNRIPNSAMFAIVDIGGPTEIKIRNLDYISHLVEKD
jgi:hypothetical protein